MSWKASAWAKAQRLGSPAAKSILMCLADYADPTGLINGWASQTQLAEDAEVSERSVREWMQKLEDGGLLTRQRQSRPNGARAADIIKLNLDATIADAAQFRASGEETPADLPADSAGRSYRQPDADLPADGDTPTGTEFRAYKEEPPLSDLSPPIEREGAGARAEDGKPEDLKFVERAFEKAYRAWPTSIDDSRPKALKAWSALTPAERELAASEASRWVEASKAAGRKLVCSHAVYLREKRWERLPPRPDTAPTTVDAPAFGPVWGGLRMMRLLEPPGTLPRPSAFTQNRMAQGGEIGRLERMAHQARFGWSDVRLMDEAAAQRGRGTTVPSALAEKLKPLMTPVRVGSELWEAWRTAFERIGRPWLPDTGRHEWVYFPAGGPEALGAFEEALKQETRHDGAGREAAE